MRKASKLVVLAALVSALFMILPSAQAAEIAGVVDGNVQLANGGIPLQGCNSNVTYTFQNVVIRGTFRTGNTVFAGEIRTLNVHGGTTGCESTSSGVGTVNSASDPATFTGTGAGTASGTFFGTYTRTESIVLVNLNVSGNVNGSAFTQTVFVRAQFTPTFIASGAIQAASFVGEFSSL